MAVWANQQTETKGQWVSEDRDLLTNGRAAGRCFNVHTHRFASSYVSTEETCMFEFKTGEFGCYWRGSCCRNGLRRFECFSLLNRLKPTWTGTDLSHDAATRSTAGEGLILKTWTLGPEVFSCLSPAAWHTSMSTDQCLSLNMMNIETWRSTALFKLRENKWAGQKFLRLLVPGTLFQGAKKFLYPSMICVSTVVKGPVTPLVYEKSILPSIVIFCVLVLIFIYY